MHVGVLDPGAQYAAEGCVSRADRFVGCERRTEPANCPAVEYQSSHGDSVAEAFPQWRTAAALTEDEPGRGRKAEISVEKVKQIVEAKLHSHPVGATHWSVRTMAAALKETSALSTALHPHQFLMAQPGRTLVSRDHRQTHSPAVAFTVSPNLSRPSVNTWSTITNNRNRSCGQRT